MNKSYLSGIIATIVLFSALSVQSQPRIKWRGSDGWGVSGRYEQMYNHYNLQTFAGQINRIDTITPMVDMGSGIQIVIKSDREEIPVILGPAWYILYQDMNLTLNDQVDVRGTKIALSGKPFVIASEVKRKDRTLVLRDQEGVPNWCAWRKK